MTWRGFILNKHSTEKFPEIDAANKQIDKHKCGVSTVKEQFGRTELNRLFLGSEINIF